MKPLEQNDFAAFIDKFKGIEIGILRHLSLVKELTFLLTEPTPVKTHQK